MGRLPSPDRLGGRAESEVEEGLLEDELEAVALSPSRFLQLAIFASACFMSAQDWNIMARAGDARPSQLALMDPSQAPVYAIGEVRFAVGLQRINSLSNVWNIYSAPGALLALWATQGAGLRASCVWGYGSQLACAVLAHAACVLPWPPHAAFALLYWSQVLGAVGQPLFLNNVTRLAADWFPSGERDAAVAVSLLAAAAGSVFISILAPAAVKSPADVDRLFLWQVPVWAALLCVALLCSADEPPQPPSVAAAAQRAARSRERRAAAACAGEARAGAGAGAGGSLRESLATAGRLALVPNFAALALSSNILVGSVSMMATLVGQLYSPCGARDGAVGAALAACAGTSGGAVVLYLLVLQRGEAAAEAAGGAEAGAPPVPYVLYQWVWSGLAALGLLLALMAAKPGVRPGALVAAWAALGLLSGTLLNGALTMEHAAEMSYPVPANVSIALLAIVGSVLAWLQVLAGTALLQLPASADCTGAATPFAAFTLAGAALGLGLLLALRPEYRRAETERRLKRGLSERARLVSALAPVAYGAGDAAGTGAVGGGAGAGREAGADGGASTGSGTHSD